MRELIDDMIHWVREQACADCKNGEHNHLPCLRCLETADVLGGVVYDSEQIQRVMEYVSNRIKIGKNEWLPIFEILKEQCGIESMPVQYAGWEPFNDEFQDHWT